jgi:hypothetical protein
MPLNKQADSFFVHQHGPHLASRSSANAASTHQHLLQTSASQVQQVGDTYTTLLRRRDGEGWSRKCSEIYISTGQGLRHGIKGKVDADFKLQGHLYQNSAMHKRRSPPRRRKYSQPLRRGPTRSLFFKIEFNISRKSLQPSQDGKGICLLVRNKARLDPGRSAGN